MNGLNGCKGRDGVPLALEQDLISFSAMQSRRFSAFFLQAGGPVHVPSKGK